jgi:hypothetical protein
LIRDADTRDRSAVGQGPAAEVEGDLGQRGGVELDQAGVGGVGEHLAVVLDGHRGIRPHHRGADSAGTDVDDEDAHDRISRMR